MRDTRQTRRFDHVAHAEREERGTEEEHVGKPLSIRQRRQPLPLGVVTHSPDKPKCYPGKTLDTGTKQNESRA